MKNLKSRGKFIENEFTFFFFIGTNRFNFCLGDTNLKAHIYSFMFNQVTLGVITPRINGLLSNIEL